MNGTGLNFNFASPSNSAQASKETEKPFVLKLKTKQIRICQFCRKDYEGNPWFGSGQGGAETGIKPLHRGAVLREREQFHYHAHKSCVTKADATFNSQKLVIPPDVRVKLDSYQRYTFPLVWRYPLKLLICISNLDKKINVNLEKM